jgi:hypothetical protein
MFSQKTKGDFIMMKSRTNYVGIRTVLCFALLSIILFYNPSDAFEEDTSQNKRCLLTCFSGKSQKVLITEKECKLIIIKDGKRLCVAEDAIIIDRNGNEIQLSELPVPCEAKIDFRRVRK